MSNQTKSFFQLIRSHSGQRSEAVSATTREFADSLRKNYTELELSEFLVLVLIDFREDAPADWKFSTCPLISAEHFVGFYASELPVSNVG